MKLTDRQQKTLAYAGIGAGAGVGTYLLIGGIGIATGGTAFGLAALGMAAIGTTAGLATKTIVDAASD